MTELILEGAKDTLDLDYVAKHGRGIQVTAGVTGFGLPPIQTRWIEGAGNGATFRGRRVLPRDIDLGLLILGEDHEDLQKLTNRLARILSDTVKLKMIEDSGREWSLECEWVGGGDYGYGVNGNGINEAEVIITLRAGKPFWKSTTAQEKVIRPGDGTPPEPLLQNFSALNVVASQTSGEVLFENEGDAPAFPLWTITGPGTRFTAALPSGETFIWEGELLASEELTIDTEKGTVVDQTGSNRYHELSEAPVLWEVPPGDTAATVLLEGTSAGTWEGNDLVGASRISATWNSRRWLVV